MAMRIIKKGDWIRVRKRVYVGCNTLNYFFIVKIDSLVGSRIRAKYFIKNSYGRYIPKYVPLEEDLHLITRKACSNEIFSSITDFKVSHK